MNGHMNTDFIFENIQVIGKILILKQKKTSLSLDMATFYSVLSATGLDIGIMTEEALQRVFEDHSAQILVDLSFSASLGEKYSYGEDRDNNRGETRQDFEELVKDDLNIITLKISIFDEYDNCLVDNIDLPQTDEIIELILSHLNDNISKYLN